MPSERLRKHLRISLRTMMVLVLILSVFLGWRVNKARQQRRAVAAVEAFGGWVHYDYEFVGGKLTPGQEPSAPVWLRRMLGDEFFREVAYVSLVYDNPGGKRQENANRKACDDVLVHLVSQTGLRQIWLSGTPITETELEGIRQTMPGLAINK